MKQKTYDTVLLISDWHIGDRIEKLTPKFIAKIAKKRARELAKNIKAMRVVPDRRRKKLDKIRKREERKHGDD